MKKIQRQTLILASLLHHNLQIANTMKLLKNGFKAGLLLMVLWSCSDDQPSQEFQDQGIITGTDNRFCACCGGWFIDIQDTTYRFMTLPEENDINLEEGNFPILVNLDWEEAPDQCLGDEIIILRIANR